MKEEKEKSVLWEDFWEELCQEDEERMRPFRSLSTEKKLKRVYHSVVDFFRYRVIGSYMGGGIVGAWHWVRCHVWNRYHVIDIGKHSATGYRWGWIDCDNAMMLACFHLLVEFVEKELPFEIIDWEHDEEFSKVGKEIKELYDWWRVGRRLDYEELKVMLDSNAPLRERHKGDGWKSWRERSVELKKKDDEMFDRLVKIRHYLWT